jgi:anti-sigma factor RsiW
MRNQRSFMNCNDVQELSPLYRTGELDPERAAALIAHLAACRDCARDVELDERLRQAVLAEAVDTAAADLAIRRRLSREIRVRRLWIAAGVAAMLVVAFVVNRALAGSKAVVAAAALDHRREVIDHERRIWFSEPDQLDALAARQGISASAPTAIAGYRMEHAKLCRLNGRIFLHVVYSDGSREFSLFLRQPDSEGFTTVRVASSGGEQVAAFETGHALAMIVTDRASDAAEFARIAAAAL